MKKPKNKKRIIGLVIVGVLTATMVGLIVPLASTPILIFPAVSACAIAIAVTDMALISKEPFWAQKEENKKWNVKDCADEFEDLKVNDSQQQTNHQVASHDKTKKQEIEDEQEL